MDKTAYLAQNPKENLWEMHTRQEAMEQALQNLLQELEHLKTLGASLSNTDDLPHPYGLCNDRECESCVAQGQEIAVAARESAFQDLEKSLLAAGGNDLWSHVVRVAQLGQAKLRQEAAAAAAPK